MRNRIIIIGTGSMCSRIYIQVLFDDSNAFFFFFRLYFCHFFLCHVSFVIVIGVRGSKKIISFVIPFLFLLLHVALDCGLPFFEISPPLFICHVILNHLQSTFLLFLFFYLLGSVISYMHLHCHGHHLLLYIAFLVCLLQGYPHNDFS